MKRVAGFFGAIVLALFASSLTANETPTPAANEQAAADAEKVDEDSEEEERPPILDTVYDDERVGKKESEKVAGAMGLVSDSALTAYVSAIGKRLARHAPRYRFQYRFRIVDQDQPNAFALPGGFIYVSRGLITLSNSEDELANVIGHEIAHVAARHAAARQQVASAMPGIVQFLARGSLAGYSRAQEREADRLGQGIAALAGYDPAGMSRFLKDLEFSERLRLGAARRPFFLDTHPATRQRVAITAQRARGIAWKPKTGIAKTREDFLRRLDGLVVGTSAAEGIFQGDRFLHPDLGFTIRFPDGWETANTHTAVGATARDRSAQVVLEHAGKGTSLEDALAKFVKESSEAGVRLEAPTRIKVGGFPALRAHGSAGSRIGRIKLLVTFIASRGHTYQVTGASRGDHERNEALFLNVARGFRPLSRELLAQVEEQRLRIVEAKSGESLGALSARTGNTWPINRTAVMNDLFATDRLEPGQLVKVAVAQPYRPDR